MNKLIKRFEQIDKRLKYLEEKTEATFQLAMETARFAQSVSDRLIVVERDVMEIKSDVAELKATQLRIEQRMQIFFDERLDMQQSRTDALARR